MVSLPFRCVWLVVVFCALQQWCARIGALRANLLQLPSDATDGLTRVASLAPMPQLCAFLAGNDKPAASLSKQNELILPSLAFRASLREGTVERDGSQTGKGSGSRRL